VREEDRRRSRIRSLTWLAVVAGCGHVDFDPAACTAFGPWSSPTPLAPAINSSARNWGGQITPDGLALYYSAKTANGQRTFVAERASRADPFASSQPTNVAIAASDDDDDPSLTGDQLEMWFDRTTPASAGRLYSTARTAIGQAWSDPILQDGVDNNAVTDAPWIALDGLSVYYTDVDSYTIRVQTRASRSDTFTGGGQLVPLGIAANVGTAWLSADQLAITFQATTGAGGTNQLWDAERQTIADGFGAPTQIAGIGAPGADDVDASLTEDGLELYFASNRSDGMTFEIYVATRTCK